MRILIAAIPLVWMAACSGPHTQDNLFLEAARASGLNFWQFSGATGDYFLPEITGSGVALIDFDGDGDLDVFFLQGSLIDDAATMQDALRTPPAGWQPGNRLFRNELIPAGNLTFVDITDKAGDLGTGYGMGAAVGDYDNDGDPDLYVTSLGDNFLLRNDGGHFTDVTGPSGTADPRWNVGAAFFDYDLDGNLDLYVAAYVADPVTNNRVCKNQADQRDYCSPANFAGLSDRLWRNDGNGVFTDVSESSGIASASGAGLGVITADFDNDGWIDIFVANDQTPNHLWRNDGDGTFVENGLMAGAAYNGDGRAEASMGVTAADFDQDGDLDLFMTHLTTETNTLYRNDGSGNFYDITDKTDLAAPSLRYTGWGTNWFDADNDGDLDLFVANGAVMSGVSDSDQHPYAQRDQLFLATDERGYLEQAMPSAAPQNSRGAAFGDIDNDGDIDIVVANNDGPAQLYLNQARKHWLSLHLTGQKNNRDAAGARVALLRPDQDPVWQRVAREGSYAAANDPRVHFGLGDDTGAVDVGVVWPDGSREIWRALAVDKVTQLTEGNGELWP